MIETVAGWLKEYQEFFWWFAILVGVSYLALPFVIRAIVIRMSADYFVRSEPPEESWRMRHPALRLTLLVLKNLVGVVLVLVGIVQSIPVFVPGFGLLTILIGVLLLNFPGKRRLELSIVRRKPVFKAINWIRSKHGRPDLELPVD